MSLNFRLYKLQLGASLIEVLVAAAISAVTIELFVSSFSLLTTQLNDQLTRQIAQAEFYWWLVPKLNVLACCDQGCLNNLLDDAPLSELSSATITIKERIMTALLAEQSLVEQHECL